ncbi:hypothetical protein BC834DRAFT_969999 [Gloeopeniophorella convolvens]|nr:hypothetical protein BC834DRAFT_969999 [Gloeopeniophorella convolvens]
MAVLQPFGQASSVAKEPICLNGYIYESWPDHPTSFPYYPPPRHLQLLYQPHSSLMASALLSDFQSTLYQISDLAFDEDSEIFIHLGLLFLLAALIWLMNSRRSWQEIFAMLDGPISLLSEGLLPNYS